MSDFFLKVALPPSGIPRKILKLIKEKQKSGEPLYVYMYQEKKFFKAKIGSRKKETCFWAILSNKPVANYQKLKWKEEPCEKSTSSGSGSSSRSG